MFTRHQPVTVKRPTDCRRRPARPGERKPAAPRAPVRRLEALGSGPGRGWKRLRDEHDETANLGILDGDRVIYVYVVESKRHVRRTVSTATEARCTRLRSAGPSRPKWNTDIDAYLDELDKVRRVGHAVDDGKIMPTAGAWLCQLPVPASRLRSDSAHPPPGSPSATSNAPRKLYATLRGTRQLTNCARWKVDRPVARPLPSVDCKSTSAGVVLRSQR